VSGRMQTCCILLLLFTCLCYSVHGSCFGTDAKWEKVPPRVSQPSRTEPNKVLVDWSTIIKRSRCVDKYFLWVWKDGQDKGMGKKYIIADKNTQTKVVDIEPCVFHNFRVELEEDDSSHTDIKASETARYNTAALPKFNSTEVHSHFTIGYAQDPVSKQFDLSKASIKFDTKFITFASCIKYVEVTGRQKSGAARIAANKKTVAPTTTTPSTVARQDIHPAYLLPGRQPYGTGRQLGELGAAPDRDWRWDGDDARRGHHGYHPNSDSGSSGKGQHLPSTTTSRPLTTQWGYNPSGRPPTRVPGGGWSYRTTTPSTTSHTTTTPTPQSLPPVWATDSVFKNKFLRLATKASSKVAGPVKKSPPFTSDTVEIIVPVEPCEQYDFELKIVNPQNAELGRITHLHLEALPDLLDYIPPPITSVVLVEYLNGGKWTVRAQPTSPVPDACLPDYMEAIDTYASRLELVANKLEVNNTQVRRKLSGAQQKVELTQAETLAQHGCLCASPRLELKVSASGNGSPNFASAPFGVYLYEGVWEGRPYYKLDLDKRSTMEFHYNATNTPSHKRSKRFIGKINNNSTSTWSRPAGSTSWSSSSWSSWSSMSSSSLPSSGNRYSSGSSHSSSSSSLSGRYSSSSSLGNRRKPSGTTRIIPIIRVTTPAPLATPATPPPVVARFLYWHPATKQWLISTKTGDKPSSADLQGPKNNKLACPADAHQQWDVKETSAAVRLGSMEPIDEKQVLLACASTF